MKTFKEYMKNGKQDPRTYDHNLPDDKQNYIWPFKIVVSRQEDKDELIKASELIHDSRDLDSDIFGVSLIMHLYDTPELIEVDPNMKPVEIIRNGVSNLK